MIIAESGLRQLIRIRLLEKARPGSIGTLYKQNISKAGNDDWAEGGISVETSGVFGSDPLSVEPSTGAVDRLSREIDSGIIQQQNQQRDSGDPRIAVAVDPELVRIRSAIKRSPPIEDVDEFRANVPEYSSLSDDQITIVDEPLGLFEESDVNTGKRALAVVRAKNLFEALDYDEAVEVQYVFEVTDQRDGLNVSYTVPDLETAEEESAETPAEE